MFGRSVKLIFCVVFLVVLLSGVQARNFTIYNSSDPSQTYFIINGDTGRIGVGTDVPQNVFNVIGGGNFTGDLYSNGAQVLTSATLAESDPFWTGNYSTFLTHIDWATVANGTLAFNSTFSNYFSKGDILGFGYYNLTDFNISDYYTSAEVDTAISGGSVNNSNLLGGYDANFFMPLNTSVSGQFDFNGGWTSNGLSIIDGNIYAQQGYFYRINSLEVTNLAVNGSLIPAPGFDNQFDLGNTTLRWKSLIVGTGDSSFAGNVGIGTTTPQNTLNVVGDGNFTGNLYSNGSVVLTSYSETDPLWTGNFTLYNSSWSSTYNESYETAFNFTTNATFVPYQNAVKNLDLGAYNFTTFGYGFFKFIGSLTNRISGLFVQDINFNGTLGGSGSISITGNVVAGDIQANNNLKVGGTGNFTGNLHSDGNLSIKNTLISIDSSGNVDVW